MNKSSKRPPSTDIDHRSTKRRKDKTFPIYSTRQIPWEEQLQLPEKFHRDGEGAWPASRILQERVVKRNKEYLVEWEPHPKTGEVFEPTWEPSQNIGGPLRDEWKQDKGGATVDLESRSSSSIPAQSPEHTSRSRSSLGKKRISTRRVVPDSSSEIQEISQNRSEVSRTPTLVGSPESIGTAVSSIEILETQQPSPRKSISVDVPPAPLDKADYESLKSSQLTGFHPDIAPASPENSALHHRSQQQNHRLHTDPSPNRITSPNSDRSLSSTRSLRSQRSSVLQTRKLPSRILSYQSEIEVPLSAEQSTQTPTPSRPTNSSAQVVHESSPRSRQSLRLNLLSKSPLATSPVLSAAHGQTVSSPLAIVAVSRRSENRELLDTSLPSALSLQPGLGPSAPRTQTTQPWQFQSQIPLATQSTGTSSSPSINMSSRSTRQSPRLQAVAPHVNGNSPRITVRTSNNRARIATKAPDISSPLAATLPELPEDSEAVVGRMNLERDDARGFNVSFSRSSGPSIPPATIPPSDMHIDPTAHMSSIPTHFAADDMGFAAITMPIQQSIEDDNGYSNEDMSLESKASSSQESLRHERLVPQVDGMVLPTRLMLGEDEYAVALPAEGKVQAIYSQTMKVKRKAILRFIHRRGSVNTASTSAARTMERNDMIELVQRLHDTTTHIDLGLPGIPTQYTFPSEEHAAYAEYAGSKFIFLGFLVDNLIRRDCTVAIMANSNTHSLIEEYLFMKHVNVRRDGRAVVASQSSQSQTSLKIELLSTKASELVELEDKPILVIAFDPTFESQDPQLKRMRTRFADNLPVLHLIVTNSSEHVERCLPVSMPSPLRLKTLVRAAYQAHNNLGGAPTYVPGPFEDSFDGRPMDMADFNRVVKKSPKRKVSMIAAIVAVTALSDDFAEKWTLPSMPDIVYDELEDTPPSSKHGQTVSMTPNKGRTRSQTPISRVGTQNRGRSETPVSRMGTPNARKRHLDADNTTGATKRQRMTPVHDIQTSTDVSDGGNQLEKLERVIDALRLELTAEKHARQIADDAREAAEQQQREWQSSLGSLQRRYEKRMTKTHELQKTILTLTQTVENNRVRIEKLNVDKVLLKDQLALSKNELASAREDLKAAGADVAAIELAKETARHAVLKVTVLEKSLESTKKDFEFLRSQYQDASNKAAEFAAQTRSLEVENAELKRQAGGEARKLKELNHASSTQKHLETITRLEIEKRNRDVLLRKQDEEIKALKKNRGVQTRGSSAQPGSPGPRSRQASPALGHHVPPGSRASVLRNER